MEVGPEGCDYQGEVISFSIPHGALESVHSITVQYCTHNEPMPDGYASPNWFSLSGVLRLAPHGLQFRKPVNVRFPSTAERGWILALLRADCHERESRRNWKPVYVFNLDERRTIFEDEHCSYNIDTSQLTLRHFCEYEWCGLPDRNADRSEKLMICALFASMNWQKQYCEFVLYFINSCSDLLKVRLKLLSQLRECQHYYLVFPKMYRRRAWNLPVLKIHQIA